MVTRSLTSAVLLCALAGTTASAQSDALPAGIINTFQEATAPAGYRVAPASREVLQFVYEIATNSDNNTAGTNFGNGGSTLSFDVGGFPTFDPGQGVPNPLPVSTVAFGWVWAGQTPLTFDFQVTFFDTFDLNATTAPFYSNALGTFRVNGLTSSAQQAGRQVTQWFQNGLQLVDANGNPATIDFPNQQFGYEVRCLTAGTDELFPQNTGLQHYIRGGPLAPITGTSIPTRYFDANFDGVLNPDPAAAPLEISGSSAGRRDVYLKLRADIPAPPPPGFVDLGTLDCAGGGTFTTEVEITPGVINFYRIFIPSDASVDASTFLDVTAGTFDGFTDADIALYNADGNLVARDANDGDLNQGLLTFGHGRRAAFGDSIQKDGRDGNLPAGTYFLAVGGGGAGFSASSFSVNGANTIDGGPIAITFDFNVGATPCALPAPVAPSATDLGVLPAGLTSAAAQPSFREVSWYTFTTTYSVDPSQPNNFLDIDNLGGEDPNSDTEIALYDSLGNLIATDDDSGPGLLAQLSFGNPATHNVPGVGDGERYNAQNGDTLPAGTYYVATALFNLDPRATGWQALTNTGSSAIIGIQVRTPTGCALDLNNDGNVDPDDLSDAIACFFDPGCELDQNGDTVEDPDDLADYIAGFFSGCP